ncbi:MAG: RDD family protein, partial [Bdellovibrionales bacterium]|nr:RDD family protein [Bdellovibrionales bacterium]
VAIVFVFSMIFTNVSIEATAQKLATQWQDQAFGLFHLGIILLILLAFAVMYLVLAGFIHGYFIYYEYKQNTTKGKKLFGLKLISINGAPITLKQCMIREMMRWIELPLILPALISILATKRRQRLGDLMAGTMLIYSKTDEKKDEYLYLPADEFLQMKIKWTIPKIDPHDANIFLQFAYPTYIYPKQDWPSLELQKYHEVLKHYYGVTDEQLLKRDFLEQMLRFHAENCLHVTNDQG